MSDRAFVDTNLFVYLYSDADALKKEQVLRAINLHERFISTQVLNEFCNVCIRKRYLPITSVRNAVMEIKDSCNLIVVDDDTILSALELHEKYKYSYYDSLMLASALECRCNVLLSEDMHDGQIVEGNLKIQNVFA
jgi:predicted nucleic acid-binding protein